MYISVKPDCPTKLLPAGGKGDVVMYIYLCTKILEGALVGNVNPPDLLSPLCLLSLHCCAAPVADVRPFARLMVCALPSTPPPHRDIRLVIEALQRAL